MENVRKACEKTIADLQCGYLNLYLIHFPLAFEHTGIGRTGFALDEEGVVKMAPVSLESTYRAMEALVDAGLVKSIGVSNYPFILYADCLAYARIKPVTNQIEAHPYFANDWFVKYCTKRGTLITAHTPLGGAAANASWRGGTDSPLVDPVITEIAARHHKVRSGGRPQIAPRPPSFPLPSRVWCREPIHPAGLRSTHASSFPPRSSPARPPPPPARGAV